MKYMTILITIFCFSLSSALMAADISPEAIKQGQDGLAAEQAGKYKKAYDLYQLAYQNGNPLVLVKLARLVAEGKGVEANGELAAAIYIQSAQETGSYYSVRKAGDIYYHGTGGVKKDYKQAFDLYMLCATDGNDDVAKYYLADLYQNGQGTKVDMQKSADMFYAVSEHKITNKSEFILVVGFYFDSVRAVMNFHKEGLYGFKKDQAIVHEYQKKMYEAYKLADPKVVQLSFKDSMDAVCRADSSVCVD